jgi:SET domain-containing protein
MMLLTSALAPREKLMAQKLAAGIAIGTSPIDGRGCFATVYFPKGRKIAEFTGEKIFRREAARRLRGRRKLRICGLDSYWSIDGNVGGNGTQYINHSCEPNCYTRIIHGHIIFFALRDIQPGEEITLDYEISYHSNDKKCRCQSPSCRGQINRVTV